MEVLIVRKRFIAYLLISILTIVLSIGCSPQDDEKPNEIVVEDNYVPVEVADVSVDTIFNEVSFSGKVYPDKDLMVLPKVPGKVTAVNVVVGQNVKKGDILFTLDKEDVEKQVEQARVALNGAKTSYELNKEKIENAKENFERTKKLYEEGAVSQSQFEQAQLAASDKSLEAAQIQVNQAQLAYDQAIDALNNLTVTAPSDGIVSSVNIEVGEMASNAQPAITIVDVNKIFVQINVPENIINEIKTEQEVSVIIESVSKEPIAGKIDSINPAADARTQLYPVKIYIQNPNDMIKPGMFAKVKLNTDKRDNVLVINSEAVLQKNGEKVVYVIENDKAVEKIVATGLDTGSFVEIVNGLKNGEKIIVKGQDFVEDGTTVKVVRGDK